MSWDLRRLRYFVATAEELHFGRAAATLHIAQPALSQQIKQLEADLGLALFRRNRRQTQLTPEGRLLLEQARPLLAEADRVQGVMAEVGRGVRGRVRLGFVGPTTHHVLPVILREVRRLYPALAVTVHEMSSIEQVAALHEDEIDLGLLYRYDLGSAGRDIRFTPMAVHEVVAVLPEAHPLVAVAAVPVEHLASELLVIYGTHSAGRGGPFAALWRVAGFSPRLVDDVPDAMNSFFALVASGAGIGLTTFPALDGQPHDVVCRPLHPSVSLELGLASRTHETSPVVARFLAAGSALAEMPAAT